MASVRRLRSSTPSTLLLGVVIFCLVAVAAAVGIASVPTWLGLGLSARARTGPVRIQSVFPGGPAALAGARPGDELIALGDLHGSTLPLLAADIHEDVGEDTQAGLDISMRRYNRVATALKASPLRLYLRDAQGTTRTIDLGWRRRPLASLGAEFWANLAFGVIAALLCGWVWALRPLERATQLFALTGLSMLAFTGGWAIHSTIELAMPTALLLPTVWCNNAGATAYGGAMIALFLCYPKRLVRGPLLLLPAAAVGVWFLLPFLPSNPTRDAACQTVTVVEMVLIIAAIALQWWTTRHDPPARAATRWLGLSVIVGAGAFIGLVAAPSMLGRAALIDPRFSLGFFLIIYVGMAVGLHRHRLFELEKWAFRILFYLGAGAALLVLDAVLVLMLRASPEVSLGAALLLVAFVYLPLRDALWRRTGARHRLKEHEMFAAIAQVALTHRADARANRWRELLAQIYEPLEITAVTDFAGTGAVIAADGVEMITPAAAGAPALALRFPWRGRGLFGPSHRELADQIVTLLGQLEVGRDAYSRGVLQERLRIARDLHDDVGARLLSGLQRQELLQTHEAMRGAIFDLRAIVSDLSGDELPLDDVLADLRHETSERLAAAGMTLDWPLPDLHGSSEVVPYRVYKNLTSACREIVSNAIRHARASQVAVAIRHTQDRLEITISDDGIGLVQTPNSRRSGLANLERRIGELAGAISYPQVERGTKVHMSLPLGPAAPA